jgi:hypothetical protein
VRGETVPSRVDGRGEEAASRLKKRPRRPLRAALVPVGPSRYQNKEERENFYIPRAKGLRGRFFPETDYPPMRPRLFPSPFFRFPGTARTLFIRLGISACKRKPIFLFVFCGFRGRRGRRAETGHRLIFRVLFPPTPCQPLVHKRSSTIGRKSKPQNLNFYDTSAAGEGYLGPLPVPLTY